jgi:adenosylcobinamide-GDP ribazoletransferase
MIRSFLLALGFLTILPAPKFDFVEDDMRRAVIAYPLVGLVIGSLLALLFTVLGNADPLLRGALVVAAWAILTGALHIDGLADMADATLAPRTEEQRQVIAKDPHVGTFGVVAIVLLLLLKTAGAVALEAAWVLLVIPVLARAAVALPMAIYPPYQASVMGAAARISLRQAAAPLLIALFITAGVLLYSGMSLLFLFLVPTALAVAVLTAHWMAMRMGGLGGDGYGSTIELTELLLLLFVV